MSAIISLAVDARRPSGATGRPNQGLGCRGRWCRVQSTPGQCFDGEGRKAPGHLVSRTCHGAVLLDLLNGHEVADECRQCLCRHTAVTGPGPSGIRTEASPVGELVGTTLSGARPDRLRWACAVSAHHQSTAPRSTVPRLGLPRPFAWREHQHRVRTPSITRSGPAEFDLD